MKKILIALLIFSMILLGLDALAQTGLGDSFLDDPPQEESNPFDDPNTLTAEQMMGDLDQFEANFDDLMKNPKSAAQIAEIYANKNNGDFAKVSHLFNDYTEATGNDKLKADLNKGTEGSYKDGTLEVAEANSLGTESESKTSIEGTNIKDGKITEDGTFSAGSLEEGSIATPDFVLGEGDSGLDASFTEMNFQNAENIEVQPNGNFRADSMESLSLSRPQFQLYMDDTQHIRKKALPVKATELKNAKNVEYRDGILKAEAADTVTIDGAESKRVFDLTVTPAELDVSIPSEYINVPALKFEQAQSLTVAGYQYNNIKDVVAVIQDNMILYIQLTSGADNNELTFPNPIPRSPKEIAIILQKDKDLQYLLKDTDVKIITTLKELVLKSLTPAEIKILYDDFVRKRGLNAVRNTESDT
ncbi:MAG: hypothetical protein QF915_03100, partial [Candidatus Woesearchaeota archaeon]|nr:hypothetical protein [Candidatus Woesearchaeota archaeon]